MMVFFQVFQQPHLVLECPVLVVPLLLLGGGLLFGEFLRLPGQLLEKSVVAQQILLPELFGRDEGRSVTLPAAADPRLVVLDAPQRASPVQ